MGGGTEEVYKPITINGSLVTSSDEIANEVYLLGATNKAKVNNLTKEIPEDHIVHQISGNISASMKFLLFTWEEQYPGWIDKSFSAPKKIFSFQNNMVTIGGPLHGVKIKQGVPPEGPTALIRFMPGEGTEEQRVHLDAFLATFSPPKKKEK